VSYHIRKAHDISNQSQLEAVLFLLAVPLQKCVTRHLVHWTVYASCCYWNWNTSRCKVDKTSVPSTANLAPLQGAAARQI